MLERTYFFFLTLSCVVPFCQCFSCSFLSRALHLVTKAGKSRCNTKLELFCYSSLKIIQSIAEVESIVFQATVENMVTFNQQKCVSVLNFENPLNITEFEKV